MPAMSDRPIRTGSSRRRVLQLLTGLGVGSAVFQRSLAAQTEVAGKVTPEMISQAEWIAGLELSDDERKAAAAAVNNDLSKFTALRNARVDYDVPPALHFFAQPTAASEKRGEVQAIKAEDSERPAS